MRFILVVRLVSFAFVSRTAITVREKRRRAFGSGALYDHTQNTPFDTTIRLEEESPNPALSHATENGFQVKTRPTNDFWECACEACVFA